MKKKRMFCIFLCLLLLLSSGLTGCGYGRNPEIRGLRCLVNWDRGRSYTLENAAGQKDDFEIILNAGGRKLILRGEDFSGTLTLSIE